MSFVDQVVRDISFCMMFHSFIVIVHALVATSHFANNVDLFSCVSWSREGFIGAFIGPLKNRLSIVGGRFRNNFHMNVFWP